MTKANRKLQEEFERMAKEEAAANPACEKCGGYGSIEIRNKIKSCPTCLGSGKLVVPVTGTKEANDA